MNRKTMYTCNRNEQTMDCDCQLAGSKVGGENEKFMGERDVSPVLECSGGIVWGTYAGRGEVEDI